MPTLLHCGLYFTPDHIKETLKHREREPLKAAWDALHTPVENPWAAALLNALRWRIAQDQTAGDVTVHALARELFAGDVVSTGSERVAMLLTLAHIAELVRDHPHLGPSQWADWSRAFAAQVEAAQAETPTEINERLELARLTLVSGIVLEHGDWFEAGAEIFRQTIRDEVRPAGYLESAVAIKDGGTFGRQFRATRSLVLMAEAAASSGVDLWSSEARGISVTTAATYLIYYYYYPEKWKWEALTPEVSQPLYTSEGGFLEMFYRRSRHKDMKLMLDDLRPVFDPSGGGLTTVTHAVGIRRGLFG